MLIAAIKAHPLLLALSSHKAAAVRPIAKRMSKLMAVPSLLALVVQLLALGLVWISSVILHSLLYTYLQIPIQIDSSVLIVSMVLLQAVFSSALSAVFGMAVWWRWIHFLFPLALYGMTLAHIPNSVYVVGFFITLSLYWTTFKTQVPFYPSRPAVWQALQQLIAQTRRPQESVRVIDIGSGLGDLSLYLANANQQDKVEGIEIAPLPWLISWLRSRWQRSTAQFILGNYGQLNFAEYDVVFAYLSPAAMPQLWQKATQEMRSGSLLVSLEFAIPDVPATQTIVTGTTSPKLYMWRMP